MTHLRAQSHLEVEGVVMLKPEALYTFREEHLEHGSQEWLDVGLAASLMKYSPNRRIPPHIAAPAMKVILNHSTESIDWRKIPVTKKPRAEELDMVPCSDVTLYWKALRSQRSEDTVQAAMEYVEKDRSTEKDRTTQEFPEEEDEKADETDFNYDFWQKANEDKLSTRQRYIYEHSKEKSEEES